MKILVTGASGQLGYDMVKELNKRGHEVTGVQSKDLDITDGYACMTYMHRLKPDAVIHCAAYTSVDRAEDEPEICKAVNYTGTENIAKACAEVKSKLLYISTDYVFAGDGDKPWETDDKVDPLNVYGLTKYLGEKAVRDNVKEHFIVRTSWVFGINGKNFVKTMLSLGKEKRQLTVVNDQIGSPTYTPDLSKLLADMIVTDKYNTYHATNEGVCSWYEFACTIMKKANLECRVLPVTSEEYPAKAKRPNNSRMSKVKLDKNGFTRLPRWENALDRFLAELGEK